MKIVDKKLKIMNLKSRTMQFSSTNCPTCNRTGDFWKY